MKKFRIFLELLRTHKTLVFVFVLTSIGYSATRSGILWLIKNFLEKTINQKVNESLIFLYIAAGLIFITWILSSLFEYLSKVYQQILMRTIEQETLVKIVNHLLKLSVRFFDRSSHGDLLVTSRTDINSMRDMMSSYCTILISSFTFLSLLIVSFKVNFLLTFWGMVAIPLISWPIIYLGNKIRISAEKRRNIGYKIFDLLVQVFNGIRLIKIFQAEEKEKESIDKLSKVYYEEFLRVSKIKALSGMILETVSGLSMVAVVVLGGIMVIKGSLQWPSLLAIMMVLLSIKDPVKNIIHSYATLKELLPSLSRIQNLLNTESEIKELPNPKPFPSNFKKLTFDNVSFSYSSKTVFKKVSFVVNRGETLGIAGPSGIGKTTLISLIPRFYDPTEGRILLDDIDLKEIRIYDLMTKIAIVTQVPFIFNASVYDNILYGRPDAKEEEVYEAAKMAYIHEEIMEMPEKYNTYIGIGGSNLSVGQKQRINIARAILKNPEILILDEATSSLDSVAESKVQKAIENLMQGKTCFIVSHRLSALRNADKIIVLNFGKMEDMGTHEELLQRNSTYKILWETQSKMDYEAPEEYLGNNLKYDEAGV